jgi:sec-independent protein translocase protein TatB
MFNIGPQELLLILVLALLVVGPERLPEIARTIGKGMRELRKAQDEVRKTIQINLDEPSTAKTRTPRRLPVDDPETPVVTGTSAASDDDAPDTAPTVSGGDIAAPVAAAAAATADPEPSGVSEMSRALGRTLAELRRAREEVQRSFRIDTESDATPTPRATRSTRSAVTPPSPEPTSTTPGSQAAAVSETPSSDDPPSTDTASRDDLERPA